MNSPGPEHRKLEAFIGKWKTTGVIRATAENPEIEIGGTDTYEWLPGGFFLLHQVDVYVGDDRNQTHEIIGFDPQLGSYTMQHFDNQGNTGTMQASVNNGVWTFLGDSLRFTGSFSQEGNVLSGIWERLEDGKNWSHFMDIKLVRDKTNGH